jgi:hypothetical protein
MRTSGLIFPHLAPFGSCEHSPFVPVQEVSLSDWDNVSVSLTWRSPRSDGGRPVTHYLVEQKGKYDIDFTQVFATEGTATFILTFEYS